MRGRPRARGDAWDEAGRFHLGAGPFVVRPERRPDLLLRPGVHLARPHQHAQARGVARVGHVQGRGARVQPEGRGRPRPSLAPRRRRAHGRRRDRRRPRRDARAQLHPAQRGLRQGPGPRGRGVHGRVEARSRPRPPAMAGVPQQHRRLRRTSRRMGGRVVGVRAGVARRAPAAQRGDGVGHDQSTPRHLPTRGDIRPGAEHTRHRGENRGRGSDGRESQGEEREEVHVEVSRWRRSERAVRQHERERGDIIIIIIFIIIIINERTRSRALGSPMRSRSSRSTRIR